MLGGLALSCDKDGDAGSDTGTTSSIGMPSSSTAAEVSASSSNSATTAQPQESSSSSISSGASTSTGSLDPETVCRTWPDPSLCPYGGDIGLPEPQDCVPVDIYLYDSPGVCDVEFETRCEVMESSILGGSADCSALTYKDGWFRELADGSVEFWGVYSNNPPLEPGLTRCRDQPEMCACECDLIQPE